MTSATFDVVILSHKAWNPYFLCCAALDFIWGILCERSLHVHVLRLMCYVNAVVIQWQGLGTAFSACTGRTLEMRQGVPLGSLHKYPMELVWTWVKDCSVCTYKKTQKLEREQTRMVVRRMTSSRQMTSYSLYKLHLLTEFICVSGWLLGKNDQIQSLKVVWKFG